LSRKQIDMLKQKKTKKKFIFSSFSFVFIYLIKWYFCIYATIENFFFLRFRGYENRSLFFRQKKEKKIIEKYKKEGGRENILPIILLMYESCSVS
jgi:hypothetical protein